MARIKKFASNQTTNLQPQLTQYGTFITDSLPSSIYFRISEFKDTFTGGKNGFLIEGSEHLLESTEIKIEIIDVNGNPIYYEPGDGIPEYYEGLSKLVAVHIYEDTPIGIANITILGELKTYLDSEGNTQPIPEEWKGIYNVKWQKEFKVNRLIANEDRVRFYKRPQVSITELIKPLYSNVVAQRTNTGTVSGIPLAPLETQPLSEYSLPTSYLLTITDNGSYNAWTSSVVGNTISVPSLGYTTTAQEIINKTQLVVTTPYTDSNGLVQSFVSSPYTTTFNYLEGINDLATALTGSFAKIALTDLTSFVGDVARVKVFRKSQSDLSDFQFIQEIQLEANELLLDLDIKTKNQENYGIFTSNIIKDYWVTSSNNLTATFNQAYLYNSVKLNSNSSVYKFHTSESISITEGVEYTLDFKVRGETSTGNGYIKAFLSGSRDGTNGKVQVEQQIVNVPAQTAVLQKSSVTQNIIAQQMATASLYFEVSGNDWYVADVSLKASQESSFSPDEITFIQSVPRTLPEETFIYRFEFYDINNNYIPVNVEETKTFNGGNLQTIRKGLQLLPSSLYFQFDSGSNPVPPTSINIQVVKTLLTGSVRYTSQSFDYDGSTHTALQYAGGKYPGVLNQTNPDNVILTVGNFTGSRSDKNVQYLEITGEVEGFTDTIVITKVLDGFGGVNYIIRPYRGTQIRNSSTASLEIQAVRIDGINEIILNDTIGKPKGWPTYQLHVLSASLDPLNEPDKFINLQKAVNQNYIKGLSVGELGSKQLNYNAIFNRDSINKIRVVYILSSGSITQQPAYIASASVLSSINLEDLQDGLDAGFMAYNTDAFTINPRTQTIFTPVSASVTGSFYKRGTNAEPFTASFEVFPSMSLNIDFEPEYWMYYVTGKFHPNISVVAIDEKKREIPSKALDGLRLPLSQSKTLTVTLTYTEDYTSSSISLDKTFTIVPEGKPGDESIVFEVVPANVTLNSNSEGIVLDYKPSITDIKLKQGSRYLIFTGSRAAGTFHIASSSISSQNITPGNVHFTSSFGVPYTASLIVSASSNLTDLSGSITYPLIIHPYYTSSIYTQSIVQNYTKAVDGPPPIDVIITPSNITLNADEVGYVSSYVSAQTTIQLREGSKFLTFNSNSAQTPGTFKFGNNPTQNITISTLQGNTTNAATASFSLFNYPHISASVNYNIIAYPYSLGPGHQFTSSVFTRTQNITKNVAPTAARTVNLTSTAYTVTYDSDGQVINPTDGITLLATAFNTTGSKYYQFFKDDVAQTGIQTTATKNVAPEDAVASGEVATWKVTLRDGSNSAAAPIRAQASVTIAGVGNGTKAYNTFLTNENASIVYTVQGTTSVLNTGTTIVATKGNEPLTAVTSFSTQAQDPFGNNIGSLGEYKVTIHSKSGHITLAGGLVSGSTVPVVSGQATIGNITGYTGPTTNLTAAIVYRIDFENGKQILFKTQSLAVQLEGKVGPGIVFRGPWSSTVDQYYFDPSIGRRDAVLYGGTGGTYYAAKSGSGDTTYLNPNTSTYFSGSAGNASAGGYVTYLNYKTPGIDTDYWEALGTQELFVAAKIAIFEESYVQNTINVGTNAIGNAANIILHGNESRPYISIGQSGGTIGYGQPGIWMGTFGSPTIVAKMSLVNTGDTNHMNWDGSTLDVRGTINATAGVFAGFVTAGTLRIGTDVESTNDGIYINANNYWYDTGYFSLGNGSAGVTWNGSALNVNGVINASSGNFSGFVTAGNMKIGANVNSTNDGIYINAQNYWYDTGEFVIGNYAGTSWNASTTARIAVQSSGNTSANVAQRKALILVGGYDVVDTPDSGYPMGTYIGEGGINLMGEYGFSIAIAPLNTIRIYHQTRGTSGNQVKFEARNLSSLYEDLATFHAYPGASFAALNVINGGLRTRNVAETLSGVPAYTGAGNGGYALYNEGTMYSTGLITANAGLTSNGVLTVNAAANIGGQIDNAPYAIITGNVTAVNAGFSGDVTGRSLAISHPTPASGTITATGNITAFFSDERLKAKLGNINNAIGKISQLNGFYYKFNELANSFGYTDDKTQLGLSAQEVQSVFPDIVSLAPFDMKDDNIDESKSGENYLTIDYSKLVPVLVEAIKELKAEIEELKKNK